MKTAVIYARYSSDTQTEQSIEGQLHVCEDYAKRNDIVILDTYVDRAMTGTNDNRPDFQRMISDSKRKAWDYVLVYKFDRFSRNKYETAKHKHTLAQNGVKVLSAMENIPDSPEGIILESVIEGMNQYYSEELSQKVRRGMKETRAKGNFTGGFIIYGYKVQDHKVVIDDERAEIVRFIFEQYSIGVYVKDIIDDLSAQGIFNRGKPFARNTVYNILKNEKYSGVYHHNGEEYYNDPLHTSEKRFHNLKYIEKVADVSVGAYAAESHKSRSAMSSSTTKYSVSDLYSLVKTYDKDFHAGNPVNPVLLDTEISDKHGNKHPNTVFMHKMYAPITYNGQLYIAKINVEEYFENEKENRRVYQLTGIKIESASKGFDGNAALSHVADTDSMNTVADLFEFVKTYGKDFHAGKPVNPVLLNEDGTPKVFYHGTNAVFTTEDKKLPK